MDPPRMSPYSPSPPLKWEMFGPVGAWTPPRVKPDPPPGTPGTPFRRVPGAPWTPLAGVRWPFRASQGALPGFASRLKAIRGVIGEAQGRPKTAQERSKKDLDGLKLAQEAPKTPQKAVKRAPKKQKSSHSLRKTYIFSISAFWVFAASKTARWAPDIAPRRPKRPPRRVSRRPKRTPRLPKEPQDRPKGAQDAPKRLARETQESHGIPLRKPLKAPKRTQDGFRRPLQGPSPPRRPKKAPGRPKRAPRRPKRAPKTPRRRSLTKYIESS